MPEPRWDVDCHDPWGRDRALTVFVELDRVLIVPPPGASAVLSTQQTRRLGQALDQAAGRAGHNSAGHNSHASHNHGGNDGGNDGDSDDQAVG